MTVKTKSGLECTSLKIQSALSGLPYNHHNPSAVSADSLYRLICEVISTKKKKKKTALLQYLIKLPGKKKMNKCVKVSIINIFLIFVEKAKISLVKSRKMVNYKIN